MHSENTDNTLFLVDGSGFIFRAFYGLPALTRPDGTPIGAVLGFTNMLLKLVKSIHAKNLAVVFDSKRENFRHSIYPAYKANRQETPADLIPQFSLIRDCCRAFDLPILEAEGYEADDLIATYNRLAREQGMHVTIVSSDKDLMQLIDTETLLYDAMKNTYIHQKQVEEKFGVIPEKVRDLLALAGDSSDNVPGVPSIGPKTAADLLNKYATLEGIYENLEAIKQPKRRQVLADNKDLAFISKRLVSLEEAAPQPLALNELVVPTPDSQKVLAFLEAQNFQSLKNIFWSHY